LNEYRLELARRVGVTVALNIKQGNLRDVEKQLGMKEGFDVGLEMSGSPVAFREMVDHMYHGGKIAMLGIPSQPIDINWNTVIFNMLTIRGIYGREMYETWYKMTVMLESGLDIRPVITHRLHYTEFEKGFESCALANRQSDPALEVTVAGNNRRQETENRRQNSVSVRILYSVF